MRLHDLASAQSAANGNQSNPGGAQQTLLAAVWSGLGQSGTSGGNIGDLAQALRTALSAGLSSGQNLAPSIAKAINDALDKAAQTLVAQGVDPTKAANLVSGFKRALSRAIDALDPPQGAGSNQVTASSVATGSQSLANSTQAASAGYASRLGESLQIVTADGDRVTIRFRQQNIVAAAGAQSSDGTVSGSQLAGVSSGRLQISVQGNLSADELKAINDLVSQVDSLAQQFFSGDLQDAFNSAVALGADPSQIAQFSLHLSYAQIGVVPPSAATAGTVPAQASGATPQGTAGASTVSASPTNAPASTASSVSGAASNATASTPTASTANASTASAPTDASTQASTGSPTATTPSSSGAGSSSGSAQQTIGSFIQDVLGKLGAVTGTSSLSFSMKWKLELLASALHVYAPSAQSAAAPATQLASGTLKSLAS